MSSFTLPSILQALRKHVALSQSELAQRLGVTPSAVHQAENAAHPIKEELFARYTNALGYPSEFDALAHGVSLLRADSDAAKREAAAQARRSAPRKRATTATPRKRAPRTPRATTRAS